MPVLYPTLHCCSLVWALPRSLATTYGITVVFSSCGYLDVSVPHVSLLHAMNLRTGTQMFNLSGFPHSDIHGSMAICASPWLFAAYHVLLRLLVPRHSPYALNSLTYCDTISRYLFWFSEFKVIVYDYCVAYNLHYSVAQQSICKLPLCISASQHLYHLRCF